MQADKKLKMFKTELELIKNKKIRRITEFALIKANSKFFYTPKFAKQTQGMIKHTKVAVLYGKLLINLEHYHLSNDEKDLVIAALILNDSCNMGFDFESDHALLMHPILVKDLLKEELRGNNLRIWIKINELISTHMGEWNTSKLEEGILPKPKTELQKIVHTAYFLASTEELAEIETYIKNGSLATKRQYYNLREILNTREIKNTLSIAELKEYRRSVANESLTREEAKKLTIKLVFGRK